MTIPAVCPHRCRATHWGLGVLVLGWGAIVEPTAQEVVVPGPVSFSAQDIDRDGYISAEEFRRLHEPRRAQRAGRERPRRGMPRDLSFQELDRDGDGKISEAELNAVLSERTQRHITATARADR